MFQGKHDAAAAQAQKLYEGRATMATGAPPSQTGP